MAGGALICALLGFLPVLGIIIITMSRRASTPTPTTASEVTPVTATPAASSSSTSLGVPLLPPLATPAAPATVDAPRVAMSASVEQRRALQELRRGGPGREPLRVLRLHRPPRHQRLDAATPPRYRAMPGVHGSAGTVAVPLTSRCQRTS